jgi:hypothetical protein
MGFQDQNTLTLAKFGDLRTFPSSKRTTFVWRWVICVFQTLLILKVTAEGCFQLSYSKILI